MHNQNSIGSTKQSWDSASTPPAIDISKYLLDGELKIELTRKKKVLYFAGDEYLLNSNALEKLTNMKAYGSSESCKNIDKTGGKITFKILHPDGTSLGYRPTDTAMTHLIYFDSLYNYHHITLYTVFLLPKQ